MKRKEGPLMREGAQGRERTLDKEIASRIKDDLGAVLNAPAGRRFFFRLVDDVCALRHVTVAGSEASLMYRHEGRRDVGYELLEEAQLHYPDLVAQGWEEWLSAHARELREREAARADRAMSDDSEESYGD